jgi:hypothetical protein
MVAEQARWYAQPMPVAKPQLRYKPTQCRLRSRQVWAIRTRQDDGSWMIVNCLDKEHACARLGCAFTTPRGEWPYPAAKQDAA